MTLSCVHHHKTAPPPVLCALFLHVFFDIAIKPTRTTHGPPSNVATAESPFLHRQTKKNSTLSTRPPRSQCDLFYDLRRRPDHSSHLYFANPTRLLVGSHTIVSDDSLSSHGCLAWAYGALASVVPHSSYVLFLTFLPPDST